MGGRRGGARWTDGLETWGMGIRRGDPVCGGRMGWRRGAWGFSTVTLCAVLLVPGV